MRAISKTLLLLSSCAIRVNKNQVKRFAKVLSQQQVMIPNQETLTGRILLYLKTDKEQQPLPKSAQDVFKSVLQNQGQMYRLSTSELLVFANGLLDKNLSHNELLFISKELDIELCVRRTEFTIGDLLGLLNVYMNLFPVQITDLKFYKHSIKILFDSLHNLSKKDLLHLIFYIGVKKKCVESQSMLRQCLRAMNIQFIANLTSEELCIICNATFKTSTKITNKYLLEKVRSCINDNLSVLEDTALFVTLVKTLRHNRYQSDDLLNTITCGVFFNKTFIFYSFPTFCHVMALYADYFYYDHNLFKFLMQTCLEQLSDSSPLSMYTHPATYIRGKDIKRLLWIISMFSEMKLVTHSDIKNVIIPKTMERVERGEFERDLDSLVDITLYLWMLNYRVPKLVPYLLNKKSRTLLSINPKTNLRLNLLITAISIEDPALLKDSQMKPIHFPSGNISTYQLHKRPLLRRLLRNLQGMQQKLGLHKFELSQDIPYLNIIGITGYRDEKRKVVHIEVLDDYTQIKNIEDVVPVGLMALKLRLLDQSQEGVLVVSEKDFLQMTDTELDDYLEEEIKLIS